PTRRRSPLRKRLHRGTQPGDPIGGRRREAARPRTPGRRQQKIKTSPTPRPTAPPGGQAGEIPTDSAERGERRDGEEIWSDIRRRALSADASPLRFVDKASTQEIRGRRAEGREGARRGPAVGRGGPPVEWGRLGRGGPRAGQLLYA